MGSVKRVEVDEAVCGMDGGIGDAGAARGAGSGAGRGFRATVTYAEAVGSTGGVVPATEWGRSGPMGETTGSGGSRRKLRGGGGLNHCAQQHYHTALHTATHTTCRTQMSTSPLTIFDSYSINLFSVVL